VHKLYLQDLTFTLTFSHSDSSLPTLRG